MTSVTTINTAPTPRRGFTVLFQNGATQFYSDYGYTSPSFAFTVQGEVSDEAEQTRLWSAYNSGYSKGSEVGKSQTLADIRKALGLGA